MNKLIGATLACMLTITMLVGCSQSSSTQDNLSDGNTSNSISETLKYTSLRNAFDIYTNFDSNLDSAMNLIDQLTECCKTGNGAEANELNSRLNTLCSDAKKVDDVPDELTEANEKAHTLFNWLSQSGAYLASSALASSKGKVEEAADSMTSATNALNHATTTLEEINQLLEAE